MLLFVGIAKKSLAGMLEPIVSTVFSADAPVGVLATWTGVLAYTSQIYADFSGYIDIAIGAALLIGIELPANFNLPYLATSPIDFWRRWHITLSSWIHDYLFIPVVRKLRRPYVALLVTWVLVGVWHGAQWAFVVYGLYHGLAIMLTRWIGIHASDAMHERAEAWPLLTLRRAMTFVVIAISFVVFRAADLKLAGKIIRALFVPSGGSSLTNEATVTLFLVVMSLVVPHLLDAAIVRRREAVVQGFLFWPIAVFAAAFAFLFGTGSGGYIYFGF
jgi:D-alanyl-lipoteichoic acid acyltransferase DltB (MBOAT superfamily)